MSGWIAVVLLLLAVVIGAIGATCIQWGIRDRNILGTGAGVAFLVAAAVLGGKALAEVLS